ncbi:MAG: CopG family transcriptional regulator [Thermoprotei archaeon]
MSKRTRRIVIELDEDTYNELVRRAEEEGFSIIADYVIAIIKRSLAGPTSINIDEILGKLKPRITRIVQDEINKYYEMLMSMKKQIGELVSRIDALEQVIEEFKKKLEERTRISESRKAPRKTGIERLHEEKVVYESMLPPRLPRDRFFNYLKREGAVIIHLSRERVAVDPDYWRIFSKKLFEEIRTNDEEEIRKQLDNIGFELFRRLRDESVIYYDPNKRRWFLTSRDYVED